MRTPWFCRSQLALQGRLQGVAAASVDRKKQKKLVRAAQFYLARLHHIPSCRFDVVLMDDAEGLHAQCIKNTFDA